MKVIKLSFLFAEFTLLEQLKVTSTQTAGLSCMKMLHIGKTICTFSFTYVGMLNVLKSLTFFSFCSQIKFWLTWLEKEPVMIFLMSRICILMLFAKILAKISDYLKVIDHFNMKLFIFCVHTVNLKFKIQ